MQIRALADIYDKQATDFQGRFKEHVAGAEVSVEYQKMLDRKDVDAVLVTTPDHLHIEIAKAHAGSEQAHLPRKAHGASLERARDADQRLPSRAKHSAMRARSSAAAHTTGA